MASNSVPGTESGKPAGTPAELFSRLLDAAVEQLAPENVGALDAPNDEIHQEILLPLLPPMLADNAIRAHWRDQKTTGFFARLQRHLDGSGEQPRWVADDFEIHVTASYSAGADARALADTLLSEESFRDLTAELLNRAMEAIWPEVMVPAPAATPTVADAAAGEAPLTPAGATGTPAEEELFGHEPLEFETEFARSSSAPAPVQSAPAEPGILAGTMLRSRPFRPQPWQTRHNPISAALYPTPSGFKNYLARNPLERGSERRHARLAGRLS